MLVPSKVVEAIKASEISLIFRRWKSTGVKAGGAQMTQRGVLGIDSVDVVTEETITQKDAKRAGFDSKQELISQLYAREGCDIYRIGVHYVGEDPRKALRQNDELSKKELDEIITKLQKLDHGSKRGTWTQLYLQMIHDQAIHNQRYLPARSVSTSRISSRGCES